MRQFERQAFAIQDRADLIHQAKIQELTDESFQISMSVPSRRLLGEILAEVNERIYEVISRKVSTIGFDPLTHWCCLHAN
jgi:hypothetical protein